MMRRTDDLRRQHAALAAIAADLSAAVQQLGAMASATQGREIAHLLARLTGLLNLHLAREDKSLYPKLMASPDAAVAAVANAFVVEMGHLGAVYGAFVKAWATPMAIVAEPALFRSEARVVLDLLSRRIVRENNELYPLADSIDLQKRAAA